MENLFSKLNFIAPWFLRLGLGVAFIIHGYFKFPLPPAGLIEYFGLSPILSSVVAISGNPGQSNYVASKSGMVGLYKSIALEVAKRNINVNIISPGFISTNMTDNLTDEQKNLYLAKIPMSKFGKPDDIANLVYFLSNDDSSYITGQNFHVNGGMLMV